MRALGWVLTVALLVGCGDDDTGSGGDAGPRLDAGDERRDAGAPAESDAGVLDGGGDAGSDAGPPAPPTSAGCVDGEGLTEGEHTFTLDGQDRRYVLRLPSGYTRERAWPLVLALHGNGGSTSYWDGTSGARDLRGELEGDAVLIVAEAIEGNWRDYDLPESEWPARIEMELRYFEEVLSRARAALCIREDGIFSMGFSGGGSFSGVLACRRDDIRAIAVGGSVVYFDEADCVGSSAAWIAISEGDFNAGRQAYRDFFRDRAGCEETSTEVSPEGCVAYDGCDAETPVVYCSHPGGHVWPDFGVSAAWGFFGALL